MRSSSYIRAAAVALALVVALGSVAHYLWVSQSKHDLVARLETYGTAQRNPGAARDVQTETDPYRAGLKAGRVLLAEELDRRWLAELSPAAREEAMAAGEAKLELARDLALEALEDRPGSWQGLMILGGSRYLLASRRKLPERWTERGTWEQPLLTAIEKAPSQPEPKRILSAAYLSEWSIANESERRAALTVFKDAFGDLDTLDQLLQPWLSKASSFKEAMSVIPADPRAWRQLDHNYRQREDWYLLARILEKLDETLPTYFDSQLQRAGRMIEGSDDSTARHVLLTAISEAPTRLEYARFLSQSLELLPPGTVSARLAGRLGEWVDWVTLRCLVAECPFSERVARRLSRLARESTPSRQARAALLAGNHAGAEAIEERSMTVPDDGWTPYLLLKARDLVRRGRRSDAQELLGALRRSSGSRPLIAHVSRTLGEPAEDLSPVSTHDSGWSGQPNHRRREWFRSEPIRQLQVRFDQVGAGGATLEVRINGTLAGFHGIETGSMLRLDVEPPSSFVRLELLREAGAAFVPSGPM